MSAKTYGMLVTFTSPARPATLEDVASRVDDDVAGELARDLIAAKSRIAELEHPENGQYMCGYRDGLRTSVSDRERLAAAESELHKWRTGHQLGAMQEDLNAMQARAVEAEARVAEMERDRDLALQQVMDVEATIARVGALVPAWQAYRDKCRCDRREGGVEMCQGQLEEALVRPIRFSLEALAAVAELKRRNGEP